MAKHEAFQSLLLLTFLALIVPLVLRRINGFLRLPIVVGGIIAGIVVGASGLKLVNETSSITFLADFGFIFLMFLSGLELDFNTPGGSASRREPNSAWRRPAWLAGLNFSLSGLASNKLLMKP